MTALPLLRLQADRVWIWADLHLHEEQADEILRFAEQIQAVPEEVEAVIVLGDLFDAWVGRKTWQYPAFQPLVEAFCTLKSRQTDLILLRGNRDVLMNPADVAPVHGRLADRVLLESRPPQDTAQLEPSTKPSLAATALVLLSHGDEYCLLDLPYQRLRRTLRRPWVRGILRALPHRLRKRIAARMRGHSERAVGRKPMDMMALDESAVERALGEVGADLAVIGHLHQERRQALAGGGFLHVLPAWEPGAKAWIVGASGNGAEDATNA